MLCSRAWYNHSKYINRLYERLMLCCCTVICLYTWSLCPTVSVGDTYEYEQNMAETKSVRDSALR